MAVGAVEKGGCVGGSAKKGGRATKNKMGGGGQQNCLFCPLRISNGIALRGLNSMCNRYDITDRGQNSTTFYCTSDVQILIQYRIIKNLVLIYFYQGRHKVIVVISE